MERREVKVAEEGAKHQRGMAGAEDRYARDQARSAKEEELPLHFYVTTSTILRRNHTQNPQAVHTAVPLRYATVAS